MVATWSNEDGYSSGSDGEDKESVWRSGEKSVVYTSEPEIQFSIDWMDEFIVVFLTAYMKIRWKMKIMIRENE